MRRRLNNPLLVAAVALCVTATVAYAGEDRSNDPEMSKTLLLMKRTATWSHPDKYGMTTGMRHYIHGDYPGALHYFEMGAYYADKFSQLSLGLMHMNGEGTDKDPITGYAWLDLAAERGYPEFLATRDRFRSELSPQQIEQAMAVRAELASRYGDAVAKWRLTMELRQGQMKLTGSHTGFGWDLSEWDPAQYFAKRDREWQGIVTVGPVKQEEEPNADDNATNPPTGNDSRKQ